MPYCGHENGTHLGAWQREGRLVDVVASSRYEDIAEAVRPFRARQRLRETRILHVSQQEADPKYARAIKDKFGTDVVSLKLPDLEGRLRTGQPGRSRGGRQATNSARLARLWNPARQTS